MNNIDRVVQRSDTGHIQIKFLDCVIGRPPSTTYGVYALLREVPSSPPQADQKHYLKAYRIKKL
jgi:hypothetical protein